MIRRLSKVQYTNVFYGNRKHEFEKRIYIYGSVVCGMNIHILTRKIKMDNQILVSMLCVGEMEQD